MKLFGTLTTINGACARIKITIKRAVLNLINSTVFKEQTFEMCGTQQINMTDNLNASEDDARFPITVENIDPWNHTTVTGTLTLRSPTSELILTGQPSVVFDLVQGAEANRDFTLFSNTPGKLKVKVSYSGNTQVKVTLKKPNGSNAAAPPQGASGQEFIYDITAADITNGNVLESQCFEYAEHARRRR